MDIQKLPDDAELYCRKALESMELTDGPVSVCAMDAVALLARCLEAQGKYEEAEGRLKRLLTGREVLLGPKYPSVVQAAHQLGRVLKKQGRFQEAETWLTSRGRGLDSYNGKDFMSGSMKSQRSHAD